jgi:RNA polymerase sigma-70 factor (sigma-E family)
MQAMADDGAWLEELSMSQPAVVDFEEFIRTETAPLLRTAYLLTGNATSAEDLVQETLTRLYPKWSRVRDARHPTAYVRRSLVNTHLNNVRSLSSRELVSSEIAERADAIDNTELVADHEWILQLLDRLPERQRAALVLSYLDDLPAADVARALGCRVGTARSLISRGLSSLREYTNGDYTNGDYSDGGGDRG